MSIQGFIIRLLDLVLAGVLLVVLLLPLLLLFILARVVMGWPVFFLQKRSGYRMRIFTIYKFRSLPLLPDPHTGAREPGAFGGFLRRSKLDELPQLLNILKGDMSFVGPRPDVPEYTIRFIDEFSKALQIKPGLFSYASLKYFNEEEILRAQPEPLVYYEQIILPDKLKLDAELAQTFSLKVYFQLLLLGLLRSLGIRLSISLFTFAP